MSSLLIIGLVILGLLVICIQLFLIRIHQHRELMKEYDSTAREILRNKLLIEEYQKAMFRLIDETNKRLQALDKAIAR